jgi:transcriptional regulator with XRE-family HTH domain
MPVSPDRTEWPSDRLGERIREARLRRGLTQEALGEAVGVVKVSVSQWESGRTKPSIPNLWRIAAALDVPADDLVLGPKNEDAA